MKTQITKQHNNVVAVQPLATFPKEDRMKKQSLISLKLAVFFAMVITMALSAVAQDEIVGPPAPYQNPLQVALKEWYPANLSATLTGLYPGGGSFSGSGAVVYDGSNIWVSHSIAGGPNKVDKLQASDGKFIGSYTVGAAGSAASPAAFDGVNIWAPDHSPSSSTVFRIRASDGGVTSCSLGTSATYPSGAAFDGTYVWFSTNNGQVVKLNPNTCAVQCSSSISWSRVYALAFDGTSMWATEVDSNQVVKLTSACTVASTVTGVPGPVGIVFDGTSLWTANQTGNSISRINPAGSGSISGGPYALGYTPWQIAYDGANVWTSDYAAGRVSKMLASSPFTLSSFLACGSASSSPTGLAFDGAHIWVGCGGNNRLGKM
jgi:hypothetical protein